MSMKRSFSLVCLLAALAISFPTLSAQRSLFTSATVVASSVAVTAVNPSGGAGYTQVFALQFTHSQGASDVVSARVRFASSHVGPGTCTARYNANGSIGLLDDAGTAWTEAAIGSGSLANSQCALDLAGSSVTLDGKNLKVILAITFSPSFAGLKQIYMLATGVGSGSTGWQARGTWTVPPLGPAPISVSPSGGGGPTWPFTFDYSDSLGAADLSAARVRFGASNVGPGTCTARINAFAGSIDLLDDSGTSWQAGTLGNGTLANSQCTLDLTDSEATVSGNDVMVLLNITFAPTFTGLKKIYLLAANSSGVSSGWVRKGTWRPNPGPGVTSVIDLGTLGGPESFAYAVNDNGQIAGNSQIADRNTTHGFFWSPTAGMVDIGTLGGPSSGFSAMNANGQIGGSSANSSNEDHPFSWTPSGGMVDIGGPGHAFAVNDDGLVAGDIGDEHAFVWTQAGGVVELGTLGGDESSALGVTGSGQVVGISEFAGGDSYHVFTWTQAAGMVDLGTFGGSESYPFAVNASGHVVGYADVVGNNGYHAFVWTHAGGMIDLGTLGGSQSAARAANANGQVVGWSTLPDGSYHAFSWTAAGGMIDLGTLGGSYSAARAVSSDGLIVGRSELADGTYHAFAWTPAGGMVDLGTLGGSFSFAYALNEHCQAVGRSTIAGDDLTNHATLWNIAACETVQGAATPSTGTTGKR